MHYSGYISYDTYCTYTNKFTNYDRSVTVSQDLGIADHVWQDKSATIAGTFDALGGEFRPAMRAGWFSYIHTAYPENAAPAASQPVGQGLLVIPD